jgi:hypothetical protein
VICWYIWYGKSVILTNEETGKLFNMTYSAVSRVINSMRTRLKRVPVLVEKYNDIYDTFHRSVDR